MFPVKTLPPRYVMARVGLEIKTLTTTGDRTLTVKVNNACVVTQLRVRVAYANRWKINKTRAYV